MTSSADRVNECVALFRARVERDRAWLSGDERVSEQTAAALLGFAEGTMKNLRWSGEGPAFYRSGINGSRITYRLGDLAAWVEARRCG